MYSFAQSIFPFNRSLTGEGVRQTLRCVQEYIGDQANLNIYEVPTGTAVYDWTIPKEWVIREAYIEDESGQRIIDMKNNNLHVLGYATPIDKWVNLEELKGYIYTEPAQPEVIPYVTSYYKERTGFCMSQNQLDGLKSGRYHMYIDSELIDGNLSYADVVIPGETDEEIMFSTYFCHPSMANNECSGPALAAELIRALSLMSNRRYTYRFVFVPETIGAITYLSQKNHLEHLKSKLIAGFVLSCVGDDNDYSYIESRYGDTLADRVIKNILIYKDKHTFYPFSQRGSDERQYNAPGVDLPVVCFCRSKFGEFPEYHTSADDMTYVSQEGFQGAYDVCMEAIEILENNYKYRVTVLCEPQLGKRGLYSDISRKGIYDGILVQRDVIAYSDGHNDLLDLSERIGVPVSEIVDIVNRLLEHKLLERVVE